MEKSDSIDAFIELVDHVCLRPAMFVMDRTFAEVAAYLCGYASGAKDCPISGDGFAAFNAFICRRFGFPQKYIWPYVLKSCFPDDEEAIRKRQECLTEFATKRKTQTLDEIVSDSIALATSAPETEPVRVWRRFQRALHRGAREEIELVVLDHPDAEVLWAGSYPEDVVPLMDEIAESELISVISGSEKAGEVVIIAGDWGPLPMKRVAENWRIDATKIIECRKANRNAT